MNQEKIAIFVLSITVVVLLLVFLIVPKYNEKIENRVRLETINATTNNIVREIAVYHAQTGNFYSIENGELVLKRCGA